MALRLTKFNPKREEIRKKLVEKEKYGARKLYMSGGTEEPETKELALEELNLQKYRPTRLFFWEQPEDLMNLLETTINENGYTPLVDIEKATIRYDIITPLYEDKSERCKLKLQLFIVPADHIDDFVHDDNYPDRDLYCLQITGQGNQMTVDEEFD